jgi:Uma2 family endonuclease
MATTPAIHVSIEEYLSTDYEPDCDYVDGVLEDRNVGKKRHSKAQARLCAWLSTQLESKGKQALPEQRVRMSSSRVRIPDVCVIDLDDEDEVQQVPPALWIEILSPEDRFGRVQRKLAEVLDFGVPTIWVIDPYDRQAWIGTPQRGIVLAEDNVLRCENLNLQVALREIIPAD